MAEWDENNYETITYDAAGNPTCGGYTEADLYNIYEAGGNTDLGGDGWTPEEIQQYFGEGGEYADMYSLFNDPTNPISQAPSANGVNWFDKLLGSATTALGSSAGTGLLGAGVNALGSYLQNQTSTDAAEKLAQAQLAASQLAAESAKFRPVGVTTNVG